MVLRPPCVPRVLASLCMLLGVAAVADAQYHERALERAREVKMLTDDREAVRKVFHDFNLDRSDETSDHFSIGETEVEVTYSSGNCSADEDVWDIAAGIAVKVRVIETLDWKLEDLKIDVAKFEREQRYRGDKSSFVFHSKKGGTAFEISDGDVEAAMIFPSITSKAKGCDSKFAREFIAHKSWFGSKPLKDRVYVCILKNGFANVTGLELSHLELSATTSWEIGITTTAVDPENDILTYNYTVTGGRIIGVGAKVKWDLTGVRSGTYTITAGVDDGCGLCGQTRTQTVIVR